ncbi:MAG: hypothetical protein GWN93_26865 [Deltaproteobacteria bacterium]|nr:hypothetical protein [Deltaproteobacteria bacterium]
MNERDRNIARALIEFACSKAKIDRPDKHYRAKTKYAGMFWEAYGVDEQTARTGLVNVIWASVKGSRVK